MNRPLWTSNQKMTVLTPVFRNNRHFMFGGWEVRLNFYLGYPDVIHSQCSIDARNATHTLFLDKPTYRQNEPQHTLSLPPLSSLSCLSSSSSSKMEVSNSDEWKDLPTAIPDGRSEFAFVHLNNELYLIGGRRQRKENDNNSSSSS